MIYLLMTTANLIHFRPGRGIPHTLTSKTAQEQSAGPARCLPCTQKHLSGTGAGPELLVWMSPPLGSHQCCKARVRPRCSDRAEQSVADPNPPAGQNRAWPWLPEQQGQPRTQGRAERAPDFSTRSNGEPSPYHLVRLFSHFQRQSRQC